MSSLARGCESAERQRLFAFVEIFERFFEAGRVDDDHSEPQPLEVFAA